MGYNWSGAVEEKPALARVLGSTARFADGSERRFDVVVFCTGYRSERVVTHLTAKITTG